MLKLCAVIYEDGYAVYTDGDRTFMLRPPYILKERVEVRAEALGRAITLHGFQPTEEEFESLPKLITCLRKRWREASPPPAREELLEGAKEALKRLSAQLVEHLLNKTEKEIASKHCWEKAQRLLWILLQNKNLQQNDDLQTRCRSLFEKCDEALSAERSKREEPIADMQRLVQAPQIFSRVDAQAEACKNITSREQRTLIVGNALLEKTG